MELTPTPEQAKAAMAEMNERYRDGGDLYVPALGLNGSTLNLANLTVG